MASDSVKIRLLLTTADSISQQETAAMLKKAGYCVINVANGGLSREFSEDDKPELGIFEIEERSAGSMELAKELYENHAVPFIVISSSNDAHIIHQAINNGALSYLLKPFHASQLLPVIESALHRARDIRRLQLAEQSLSTAIESSRIISAAIGIMMERFRLTNKMAFEILRAKARSNQKKVLDMANEILVSAETVNQINLGNNEVYKK